MEAWYDDNASGATCGVKILEKLAVHDDIFGGSFEVRIELDLPATMPPLFSHANLHILSAKLHMREELITRISGGEDILPVHYSVTIDPDLLSTSPTIAYTGQVVTVFEVDKESKSNTIRFHMEDLDMTS